ncbi:Heat shock protein FtsJ/RrmJ @ Ribosomal RNA large subunit methyltransferase E [hydrothermal vent metagenome]|uniref:Heat shock protein FtsJ/RrmJ @ Ribosomal RNA large subunit methyltransferase E n=1 Tax=hydrothermal vent metagenome TaxID=652676 RepID=A0A1W1BSK0_9ZZZZ
MTKKASHSKRWMAEHINDEFVKKAKEDGYRCRAVYKLLEIIEKTQFIKQGSFILDLGSAPGGWSEICAKKVGKNGKVIASDILDMDEIPNVEFIKGDFCEEETYKNILKLIPNGADVVLSDMAPNMSGQLSVDMPKSYYLAELALDIAKKILKSNGYFLVKIFQGEGFDEYVKNARITFKSVSIKKPKASRARSKEVYLFAHSLK